MDPEGVIESPIESEGRSGGGQARGGPGKDKEVQ
jgi:hypothetical protein